MKLSKYEKFENEIKKLMEKMKIKGRIYYSHTYMKIEFEE